MSIFKEEKEESLDEPVYLVCRDVSLGPCRDGIMLPVPDWLRENLKDEVIPMIYLTAAIAVFLFVYLVVALVRPEWF